ncbi:TPA: hypothetical protein HA234_00135 [Candidatus Woesearchaeota archaeon]|nr:hypothetical protein [Candidatus Woesearchaeota archaeon]
MVASSKKGQAAGAAVLLAIIAGLLILFIILVPPKERAELLGDQKGSSSSSGGTISGGQDLLLASPGRIDYLNQREIEHPLPIITVETQTETKIIAEKNLAYAKKAVFSEKTSPFTFSIDDLDHTGSVLLSFSVDAIEGMLIISLNGEEIYYNQVELGANTPIPIPKNALKAENQVIFAVSSPGVALWRTNEVSLSNIKLVADVTNVESQSSRTIFLVSETERQNVEKAILRFQPGCAFGEVGRLSVEINGDEIYSAIPDCDVGRIPVEFSPSLLHAGENQVVFKTVKGKFLLSHVLILYKLKEVDFPVYYFELSNDQLQDIRDGASRVRLTMNFVDVTGSKLGEIVFNGNRRHFDTREVSTTLDLSDDAVRGSNSIKIKPEKTIEVRELRVELVE